MEEVRRFATEAGRDPAPLRLAACRSVEVTSESVPQDQRRLRGSSDQLVEAIDAYRQAGVSHLALQFMVPRWPERREQIERFGAEVIPRLARPAGGTWVPSAKKSDPGRLRPSCHATRFTVVARRPGFAGPFELSTRLATWLRRRAGKQVTPADFVPPGQGLAALAWWSAVDRGRLRL